MIISAISDQGKLLTTFRQHLWTGTVLLEIVCESWSLLTLLDARWHESTHLATFSCVVVPVI